MMGNIEGPRRLKKHLMLEGIDVTDEPHATDYDILHVHTPIPLRNIIEVKKAKKKGAPVVMHTHTTAEDARGTWTGSDIFAEVVGRYLTLFYNMGDLVIAPSEWTKGTLKARGITARIEVLSSGIDLERFRFEMSKRKAFREKYGIPEDATVAYVIGVVCVKKGVQTLPQVAKELPDISFVWIGKRYSLYRPFEVNGAIARCPENVRFFYDVADVVDAHCGGDMFFMPSFAENLGLVILEAMAVGRPIVARGLDVYSDMLANGKNALICGNVDEFCTALEKLKGDSGLSRSLVDEGKKTITGHEMGKITKQLIGLYESVLNNGK